MAKLQKTKIIFLSVFLFQFCFFGMPFAQEITARIGIVGASGTTSDLSAQVFKKLVEEKLKGRFKVNIYTGGQLGGDKEIAQALQLGTVEMSVLGTGGLAMDKRFEFFYLPWVITGYDHYEKVMVGTPLDQEVRKIYEQYGIKALAAYPAGFRAVINTKRPIHSLEDFKGLKIRTSPAPHTMKVFRLLGANPTPISFDEIYTALKTGVVDGVDSGISWLLIAKSHEVAKYLSITKHALNPTFLSASLKWWKTLPPDIQSTIEEAAAGSVKKSVEIAREEDEKALPVFRANKVAINESTPDEIERFKEVTKPMADEYIQKHGSRWIDMVSKFK